MGRLAMAELIVGRAVDFDQHEMVWRVGLLDDIEARDPGSWRLLRAFVECGVDERLQELWLNVDEDVDNVHATLPRQNSTAPMVSIPCPTFGVATSKTGVKVFGFPL